MTATIGSFLWQSQAATVDQRRRSARPLASTPTATEQASPFSVAPPRQMTTTATRTSHLWSERVPPYELRVHIRQRGERHPIGSDGDRKRCSCIKHAHIQLQRSERTDRSDNHLGYRHYIRIHVRF